MPARFNSQDATKDSTIPLRAFHLIRANGVSLIPGCTYDVARVVTWMAGVLLLFTTSGCLATRSWVNAQLGPMKSQLGQTDAKADQALNGLQNLHLEKQLVLDSSHGPTFTFGSAALTDNAKRQINGFFEDIQGSTNSAPASAAEHVIVVAGYTDSIGSEDYNYQLGQQRADRVAGYLVSNEGIDPTQIRTVSYGPSHPVADNDTSSGRRRNRRVEISVYQEKIAAGTSGAGSQKLAIE